jgi:hypothetical protein
MRIISATRMGSGPSAPPWPVARAALGPQVLRLSHRASHHPLPLQGRGASAAQACDARASIASSSPRQNIETVPFLIATRCQSNLRLSCCKQSIGSVSNRNKIATFFITVAARYWREKATGERCLSLPPSVYFRAAAEETHPKRVSGKPLRRRSPGHRTHAKEGRHA